MLKIRKIVASVLCFMMLVSNVGFSTAIYADELVQEANVETGQADEEIASEDASENSDTPQEEAAAEEPKETLAEEPAVEEPKETPAEEPTVEEPKEAPAEEPALDEPEESPGEEPALDEPKETPAEEPAVEEPKETPAEEPTVEEPKEIPAEEPTVEEPKETPAEEPTVEEPKETPAEEPALEEPKESPGEEPKETPAEEPAVEEPKEAPQEVPAKVASEIKLTADKQEMKVSDTAKITVQVLDADGAVMADEKITWNLSDTEKASFENGTLTANQAGGVTLIATLESNASIKAELTFTIEEVVTPVDTRVEQISAAVDKLTSHYGDSSWRYNYEFVVAPAYYQNTLNTEAIGDKTSGYTAVANNAYKGIIVSVASGLDPRAFIYRGNEVNYVETINQDLETGAFASDVELHAFNMIALKIAQKDFDEAKAIEYILTKINISGEQAWVKDYSKVDYEATGTVLTALGLFKGVAGAQDLIDKICNKIKADQDDNGGFGYDGDPKKYSKLIMGMNAAGINPLSDEYKKENGSLVDALLEYQMDDGQFKAYSSASRPDDLSTAWAYLALTDLKHSKTSYDLLKAKVGETPSKIMLTCEKTELIAGNTVDIKSKIIDAEGLVVPGQKIIWSLSDKEKASFEDGTFTAIQNGQVTLTGTLESDSSIKAEIVFNIEEPKPTRIEVRINNEKLKEAQTTTILLNKEINVETKVFDQDDKLMNDQEVSFEVTDGGDVLTIADGKVISQKTGQGTLKFTINEIAQSIKIKIVSVYGLVENTAYETEGYFKGDYEFIAALALNHAGKSQSNISDNIDLVTIKSAADCAKNIIAIIAAGEDPRDYDGVNYVQKLMDSKSESGYFEIGSSYYAMKNPENIAYPIIALNMAKEPIDQKIVDNLVSNAGSIGSNKAYTATSAYNTVENTSIAIIALSFYKDQADVKALITKCAGYLKYKQVSTGGFEGQNSSRWREKTSIGDALAIQAIIAIGQDPFSSNWMENEKSIYDALLGWKCDDGFKEKSGRYSADKESTSHVYAALVDMYKNKSMFHEISVELGDTPNQIILSADKMEIKERESLKIKSKIVDADNKMVIGQKINWSADKTEIAEIDENGLLTIKTLDKDEKIVVTASVEGTSVSSSIAISIKQRIPSKIEIVKPYSLKESLKEGEEFNLSYKIYEADESHIEYAEGTWESSNPEALSISKEGKLVAHDVAVETEVTIKAVSSAKSDVFAELKLKVMPIIPAKIDVSLDDKTVESLSLEAGMKYQLSAKAYEADKTSIKDPKLVWSSDDESLTIVDGLVTVGEIKESKTTKIHVKVEGFDYSKDITVNLSKKISVEEKTNQLIASEKTRVEAKSVFTNLEGISLKACGTDAGVLKAKLEIEMPNFKDGYLGDDASVYAKAIMALISLQENPYAYKEKDLVTFLKDSQDRGVFAVRSYYYGNKAEEIAQSMIALDALSEEYEAEEAIQAIIKKMDASEDRLSVDNWKGIDYQKTALAYIALANHQDLEVAETNLPKIKNAFINAYKTKEMTNSDLAWTVLALKANNLDLKEVKKVDELGNESNIAEEFLREYETSEEAFAALVSIKENKSVYQLIEAEVGDVSRLEFNVAEDVTKLKTGKKAKLTVKAYDANGLIVKDAELIWENDNLEAVGFQEATGEIIAKKAGVANIVAKLKSNESVKQEIKITVIPVIPAKLEASLPEGKDRIFVGEKTLLSISVFDGDGENIDSPQLEIKAEPSDVVLVENLFIKGLKAGDAKIKIDVLNNGEKVLSKELLISVQNRLSIEEKINQVLEKTNSYFDKQGSGGAIYLSSIAMRNLKYNFNIIQDKKNIYGMASIHNDSRNIMNLIAAGINPREYKGKDYVQRLLDENIDSETDPEYVAKAILALDFANEELPEKYITKAKSFIRTYGNKKYVEVEEYDWTFNEYSTTESLSGTLWIYLALANYYDESEESELFAGIENYLVEKLDSKTLLVNDALSDTSLMAIGLISSGQDIYSEKWTSADEFGNKRTILDGILDCYDESSGKFKNKPTDGTYGYMYNTEFAVVALSDIRDKKSSFKKFKYLEAGEPAKIIVERVDDSEILAGDKIELVAKVYDENDVYISGEELVWKTSDPKLANVEDNFVKTLAVGEVKVTASLKANPEIKGEISLVIKSGLTKEILEPKVKAELDLMKNLYIDKNKSYEYLAAPAANIAGIDLEIIQGKLYRASSVNMAGRCAMTIIEYLGGDKDPRKYENRGKKTNLIDLMVSHQVPFGEGKGQFIINKGMDSDNIIALSNSIIALDMAEADYDRESAIDALLKILNDPEMTNSEVHSSYKEILTEGRALAALANYKDHPGVEQKIEELIEFLKTQQNEDGGFNTNDGQFENSPEAINSVVQGLIANGINPLYSAEWVKERHTVLDGLKRSKVFKNEKFIGYSQYEGFNENYKASYSAFAALSDMYSNKSMYEELKKKFTDKIERGELAEIYAFTPSENILKIGEKTTLKPIGFDSSNNIVELDTFEWKSSDEKIAKVSPEGQISPIQKGAVTITITSGEVTQEFSFSIVGNGAGSLSIDEKVKTVRVADVQTLKAIVLNEAGEKLEGQDIVWGSKDENIIKINAATGEITPVKAGKVIITAKLKNSDVLKDELEIKVIEKTSKNVNIEVIGLDSIFAEEQKLEVDNFELGTYGNGDGKITETPTAMNAVIAALEMSGMDCRNDDDFDAGSNVSVISSIKDLKNRGKGENSGWMYFVNDAYVDKNFDQYILNEDDELTVFYVEDYMNFSYTFFNSKADEVKINGELKLNLKSKKKNSAGLYPEKPVVGAKIMVDGKEYKLDGKSLITDSQGNVTIKFDKAGNHVVSAIIESDEEYVINAKMIQVKESVLKEKFDVKVLNKEVLSKGYEGSLNIEVSNKEEDSNKLICLIRLTNTKSDLNSFSKITKELGEGESATFRPGFKIPVQGNTQIELFLLDDENNKELVESLTVE